MSRLCRMGVALFLLAGAAPATAQPPAATDDRLVIELVAKEPEIVTPTGLAVDEKGRVWVIENNTHERPASYHGYPSDRIRIFDDFDAHGRPRRVRTFADGFRNAMNLALRPDGSLYVVTRSDVYRLRDTAGRGVATERTVLVHMETKCTYPHNALGGITFDPLGNLYLAMGENLGVPYKLIGADGTTFTGGGEGGNMYRCRADGTGLVRIATGFWNPFALTFDAFGRLFAVDNDPDARGPCRFLHIIRGGDYGYRYRNGRRGLHPFTAWNGELPGTLPMASGTAEAPSGIVAYESTGLPADYRGDLLVTSWGDHVIERFRLNPRGASFSATSQTLVRGGEDFRPVALVTAPDGSLYLTDWVDKSYPVHGKGRIWRIRMKHPSADDGLRVSAVANHDVESLIRLLHDPRREIRDAASRALASKGSPAVKALAHVLEKESNLRSRMQALWTAAMFEPNIAQALIQPALRDRSAEIRAEAARLLGEVLPAECGKENQPQLLQMARSDPSAFVRMEATLQLRGVRSVEPMLAVLAEPDPFLAAAALEVLGRADHLEFLDRHVDDGNPQIRLGVLLALRRTGVAAARAALPRFLADADPAVRRAAIQWVGEDRLRELTPLLEQAVARVPVTRAVFEAYLATSEFLHGGLLGAFKESSGQEYIASVARDVSKPPSVRALALRMLRPDAPGLRVELLTQFLGGTDPELKWEAARTLALRSDEPSQVCLRRLAADDAGPLPLRQEAIMGLAQSAPTSASTRRVLMALLNHPELERDALRSLRGALGAADAERALVMCGGPLSESRVTGADREIAEQIALALTPVADKRVESLLRPITAQAGERPRTADDWRKALSAEGDAQAGERVFFHPRGPRCFACHRVDGRGGVIGPDLSLIGQSTSREKLIESILEPSKEIAPAYVSWLLTTRDGKVRTGVIVEERFDSTIVIGDAEGKTEVLDRNQIEERHALSKSIMPDNLPSLMTRQEFRDLIAFLQSRK